MKCMLLLKLVRGKMKALLAIKDTLMLLLIRQPYVREKKREANMVMNCHQISAKGAKNDECNIV